MLVKNIIYMAIFLLVPLVYAGEDLNMKGDYSTDPKDYIYFNNGDQVWNGEEFFHPSSGTLLTSTDCSTSGTSQEYINTEEQIGNMSIDMDTGGGGTRENRCNIGTLALKENTSMQCLFFDDAADATGIAVLQPRGASGLGSYGVNNLETSTHYYYEPLNPAVALVSNVSRFDGGMNITWHMAPGNAYLMAYFNGTATHNDSGVTEGWTLLRIVSTDTIDIQIDNCISWNGSIEERPLAEGGEPPEEDICDCPTSGDWNINDGSICYLTTACDLGLNDLIIDFGALHVDAGGSVYADNIKVHFDSNFTWKNSNKIAWRKK